MLHPVPQRPGPHLFCGPTAICAVTGLDPVDVLAAAHRYMQRPFDRPVTGMTLASLVGTMALVGWRCELFEISGTRPTLAQLVTEMKKFKGAVILNLSHHYAAVTYTEYVCNHTDGAIVPLFHAPNQRARVKNIIEVNKL